MAKHTPGPWRYRGWPSKRIDAGAEPFNSGQIAEVDTYGTKGYGIDGKSAAKEAEANARLIASAPELLEAVKDLIEYAEIQEVDLYICGRDSKETKALQAKIKGYRKLIMETESK